MATRLVLDHLLAFIQGARLGPAAIKLGERAHLTQSDSQCFSRRWLWRQLVRHLALPGDLPVEGERCEDKVFSGGDEGGSVGDAGAGHRPLEDRLAKSGEAGVGVEVALHACPAENPQLRESSEGIFGPSFIAELRKYWWSLDSQLAALRRLVRRSSDLEITKRVNIDPLLSVVAQV